MRMSPYYGRMPDFTWEWVLITDGYRILHENESLLRTDIGFYMRMSPYYGRTLYDRTNGLNAGFNIRKSPFTDGYNMAERMAWTPHFYTSKHFYTKRESFHGRIFHGRTIGLKAGSKAGSYIRNESFYGQLLYGGAHCSKADTEWIWKWMLLMTVYFYNENTPTGGKSGRNEARELIKTFLLQTEHPRKEIVGGQKNVF